MSFRPKRSGEPESSNLLIELDSRVRENDSMDFRRSSIQLPDLKILYAVYFYYTSVALETQKTAYAIHHEFFNLDMTDFKLNNSML